MTQSPESRTGGGGGAATSAGVKFQERLGAVIAASLLSGHLLDQRFGLGGAKARWLRFETEAPVDDILVATTKGGFIAIQAKTRVNLSSDPQSPFGKTIAQFVQHWRLCRDGDGGLEWNRPLDPARDRLVLAVDAQAAASVRRDLPDALRLSAQIGREALSKRQKAAFDAFEECVHRAWRNVTEEAFDSHVIVALSELISVASFDLNGADNTAIKVLISNALPARSDPGLALAALTAVCGRMMYQRGGGDLRAFRSALQAEGVDLEDSPRYQQDIKALRAHSEEVARTLERYENIEAPNAPRVTIRRDCQSAVELAAETGSLLILGEPGTGKSAVLNAVARGLRERGDDVLELAVDGYSVESLEGLARELKLEHALLDVLEAWDGTQPGWLIIDALDATRGGSGEGAFRTLIQRVLEMPGRWRVIASIRTFDLRMGQQLRSLFKGKPPVPEFAEPVFTDVRHIRVPHWSAKEFERILDQAPDLAKALDDAPERLRELAMVPFNTRLLAELLAEGLLDASLRKISSQVELLQVYWRHRVDRHGLPAKACLDSVVKVMLERGNLRASVFLEPSPGTFSDVLDVLSREGVLIRSGDDRWIQFRHHILFDFAAARTVLDPDGLVSGRVSFSKDDGRGLMIAPALAFVLQETWELEANHAKFWTAIAHLVSNKANDPVIRSVSGRIGAEYPAHAEDAVWLAQRVATGDHQVTAALGHIFGALSAHFDDVRGIPLAPWVRLAAALAPHAERVTSPLRFLLNLLTDRVQGSERRFIDLVQDPELRRDLGSAARALLKHAMAMKKPGSTARAAIEFVAKTYSTDPIASKELLVRIFDPSRLDAFASEEVPALCRKIAVIAKADPEFAAEIFGYVYGYQVTEERVTQLGYSQILPMTSNARQDYGMACFHLGEFFPEFVEQDPRNGVEAVFRAVESYVAREKPKALASIRTVTIAGQKFHLREDQSHIWAHDPDTPYGDDAKALVGKLLQRLRTAPEEEALALAFLLMSRAAMAVFWSRLFLAAAERGDGLLDLVWPIAADEAFLVPLDTRKDAIDVVAKGILQRGEAERVKLEQSAFHFDFSAFHAAEEEKEHFLHRLFGTIGSKNLLTRPAQNLIVGHATDDAKLTNKRPLVITTSSGPVPPYHWIQDLDRDAPANAALITAIDHAKAVLGLEGIQEGAGPLDIGHGLDALEAVRDARTVEGVHPSLRLHGEGLIGEGGARIVSRLKPSDPHGGRSDQHAVGRLLELLMLAARSESPKVREDAESSFERSPSWSSPAARVGAAEAIFELCLSHPNLYPTLRPMMSELLIDQHPAVRLQAGLQITRIWGVDRPGFWQYLGERLAKEPNVKVLEYLLNGVVARVQNVEPNRVLELILSVLGRREFDQQRAARIRCAASDVLSLLWVTHGLEGARDVLAEWIDQPHAHAAELSGALFALRPAVISGLPDPMERYADVRKRARWVFSGIVDAANKRLDAYVALPELPEEALKEFRECIKLVDAACQQLHFAAGNRSSREEPPGLDPAGLAQFFRETSDLLHNIGDNAPAHTVYHLLQLLERLVAIDPARAFDLAAHALRAGGARSGYQYESMGLNLMVRLVGVFLADHKEIFFEEPNRRAALIECLEAFMEAGWPAAQRLLYRLPELIR